MHLAGEVDAMVCWADRAAAASSCLRAADASFVETSGGTAAAVRCCSFAIAPEENWLPPAEEQILGRSSAVMWASKAAV
jgi:hypothetical protein